MILGVLGVDINPIDSRVTQKIRTELSVKIDHSTVLLPVHDIKAHVTTLIDIRVTRFGWLRLFLV